jgi:hypothetical protein
MLLALFPEQLAAQAPPTTATIRLDSPLDWQVFQRKSAATGRVEVRGGSQGVEQLEVRFEGVGDSAAAWQRVPLHTLIWSCPGSTTRKLAQREM